MRRANLDKKKPDMAAMFDGVAKRYDVMNDLMTGGLARYWRKVTTASVEPMPGEKILDIAAGTGTSSIPYVRAGAEVTAADISPGMIAVGQQRYPELHFTYADACDLPFPENTFDAVTMVYGFRNVEAPQQALREIHRVLKPGGRAVITEFSTPRNAWFAGIYKQHLLGMLPYLAKIVSSHPEAYVYLTESISTWPEQEAIAALFCEAGFDHVQYRNLSGGIVAIHRGYKPLSGHAGN